MNGLVFILHNAEQQLSRNLKSILQVANPISVRVIDNGSTDNTVPMLESAGIPVHVNPTNKGRVAALNDGFRHFLDKDVEWIFNISPDMHCPPAWDTIVDDLTAHAECGIIGCRTTNYLGKISSAGGFIGKAELMYWPMPYELPNGLTLVQSDFVTTTRFRSREKDNDCMERLSWVRPIAYRASMLREVGLLDESYFNYRYDANLCMRAWQSGWEVWYNPLLNFMHEGGTSIKRADSTVQELSQDDLRRFALLEEAKWLQLLGDSLPLKM